MANNNHVASRTPRSFGNYNLAEAQAVSLAATGNTIVALPILGGGVGTNGSYILRRITISNPANVAGGAVPNCAGCNVSIITSNDGNASNAVAAAQTLTNVTAAYKYQDLTLATATTNTAQTASVLFLKINSGNVANASATIAVYGDLVNP